MIRLVRMLKTRIKRTFNLSNGTEFRLFALNSKAFLGNWFNVFNLYHLAFFNESIFFVSIALKRDVIKMLVKIFDLLHNQDLLFDLRSRFDLLLTPYGALAFLEQFYFCKDLVKGIRILRHLSW